MANPTYCREAPTVTVALFCYNQEKYIKDAVLSVLNQDYTPLKIIISDDCSTDRTYLFIEQLIQDYQGPHEVLLNRNQGNLGLIRHVNLVNDLVNTELLVAAAGDDISHPNRVSEIIKAYCQAEKQPTSIYSSVRKMNPDGELLDVSIPPIEKSGHSVLECSLRSALIIGASHAWHKSLFSIFGEITEYGAYEDLVLAYRSAILEGLLYIDQPLIDYRVDVGISHIRTGSHQSEQERFERYQKIMYPVLKQRLIDSEFIKDEKLRKIATNKIEMELRKMDIQYAFFKMKGTSKNTHLS